MNKTVNMGGGGKRLSTRIYLVAIGVIAAILILILAGLGSGNNKKVSTKEEKIETSDSNAEIINALQKIPDSMSAQQVQQPAPVAIPQQQESKVDNAVQPATSTRNVIKDETEARLREELEKMKREKMRAAMNSPLTLNDSNTAIAQTEQNNNDIADVPDSKKNNRSILAQAEMPSEYQTSNMQSQKEMFMNNAGKNEDIYLNQKATSQKYALEVKAGSIIPAVLMTGINSDLPGTIVAKVSRNVYDSTTGRGILIPQGSTLIGVYNSQISYGQDRVMMVWSRVIFPDGQNLSLEGMPGADLAGYSGLNDRVNNHYWKVFSSAVLMSLFSAGIEASTQHFGNTQNSTGFDAGSIISGALGLQLGQAGMAMVQKNLNIQPTIEIRPGCEFNVLVTRDIPFQKAYKQETY